MGLKDSNETGTPQRAVQRVDVGGAPIVGEELSFVLFSISQATKKAISRNC